MIIDRVKHIVSGLLPSRRRASLSDTAAVPAELGEVFSRIYAKGDWGRRDGSFYSGDGSHDPSIVEPYTAAVKAFLGTLPRPWRIVDLGCGDFNVGSQLAGLADEYVACDVVPGLIERNRANFRMPQLRFEVLNIVTDPLPSGRIVLIRQVFQHLANAHIQAVVDKLDRYDCWIVTEHLPAGSDFVPNLDKRPGRNIRLDAPEAGGSGVVLTAPPFNVAPLRQEVLCEVPSYGGVIRTTAYRFT